jgi:hypothetical protein
MKFTCEIDTEERSSKFMIDGQEVTAAEFSVGCYNSYPYSEGSSEKGNRYCYVSVTQGDMDNRWTHSISFSDGEKSTYSESKTKYSVAKEIGKSIARLFAAANLSKALSNKDGKK